MKSKFHAREKIKLTRKKLWLVLFCAFSVHAFSQASATQPENLYQCGNEVFNLTVQTPAILGSQPSPQFTVTYFVSQSDADNAANPIASPMTYVSPPVVTIYARVDNTSDGSYATTSFQVSWESPFQVPDVPDVSACGSYTLLPVLGVSYSVDEAGTIPAPGIITTTTTIYRHLDDFPCSIPSSFVVSVNSYPVAIQMPNITVCDGWITQPLPAGQTYHTSPGGSIGTIIPAGTMIYVSSIIYVFAESGTTPNCTDESSFVITVNQTPQLPPIDNIVSCAPVTLPDLAFGGYYTGPMGTGTQINPGDMISTSQTIYAFMQSGTSPNCYSEQSFQVVIGPSPVPLQTALHGCDPDGDGFAPFDLNSAIPAITDGNPNTYVTFHESLADAQAGINALSSPYINIAPFETTLYIRLNVIGEDCFSIGELPLVAAECGTISGIVRFDQEGDGCDADDEPLGNIQVIATTGNSQSYAYTNANGEYTFTNVADGGHSVYIAQNSLGTVSGGNFVTVSGSSNATVNFCIAPVVPVNDASVYIWPYNLSRPGFPTAYRVQVYNGGNTYQSGTVTLAYDDVKLNFTSASPLPDAQSEGSLQFSFSNLPSGQYRSFLIDFMVEIPPTANAGDLIALTATVLPTTTDATPNNNTMTLSQVLSNSFDPNDKTVLTEAMLNDNTQDYLQYIVRFQNTGTAEAIDVKITDQLDPNLDWSTFRPVSASHDYMAQMNADGLATFTFEGINLPDSTTNEPASHGFVAYEVKLKSGLTINDDIYNTANIYFDFNAPIVTNTVMTDLVALLGIGEHSREQFALYPNPASGFMNIRSNGQQNFAVELFDIQGKKIIEKTADGLLSLDVSMLQKGLYFVKVTTDNATETKKLIVK